MYFFCKTDKGALDYKAGETMQFTLTLREDGETVSEMFSEGVSEMRDSGFLDPDNGIISDTQPN